ncbi:hypothetical protein BaRGS_00010473 [Batillaria attramentaria]|uniref:Uncharacterized protein n=1 Tax=Batillaria attramentaria TaxID=370345 RepID=A0ABD0LGG6_9CAEN
MDVLKLQRACAMEQWGPASCQLTTAANMATLEPEATRANDDRLNGVLIIHLPQSPPIGRCLPAQQSGAVCQQFAFHWAPPPFACFLPLCLALTRTRCSFPVPPRIHSVPISSFLLHFRRGDINHVSLHRRARCGRVAAPLPIR